MITVPLDAIYISPQTERRYTLNPDLLLNRVRRLNNGWGKPAWVMQGPVGHYSYLLCNDHNSVLTYYATLFNNIPTMYVDVKEFSGGTTQTKGMKRLLVEVRWDLQQGHCYYCGRSLLPPGTPGSVTDRPTLDHRIPRSKRGVTSFANVVVACKQCNSCKGSAGIDWRPTQQEDTLCLM
jgi:5-methylcytosine-specific restriction endonuclease McrA